MKTLARQIYKSPKYAKVIEWGKLISITSSAQILVQALGFISGILVIRLLPSHEYALYTLANTMLGTMTILADGGITQGVMAQGGKVWQDREKLGGVLITGLELRKKFAIGSLIIATPLLLMLLRHHDASWLMSILLVASLIPAFFSTLSGNLLQIPLKLKQDITPLQINQVGVNIGRLILISLTLFIFPWAFLAILSAGLPQIWANLNLRKISSGYVDLHQKTNIAIQKKILIVVKRLLPGAIYFCISGQITIWLISIFGSTVAIAQIGALGRLAMVLSLISMIFHVLIIPRFIRLPNQKKLLLKLYVLLHISLICLCLFIICFSHLFSPQLLWILGRQYSGLNHELTLQITGSCLNMIVGISYVLNSNKGWIMNPVFGITFGLIGIISGILLIDITTLKGILYLNIFTGVIGAILYFSYGILKINKSQ